MSARAVRSTPRALPSLPADAHKGDAGRILVVCGSFEYPGAAILVARAAQRAGAGLVTIGCQERELARIVPAAAPEAVYLDLSGSAAECTKLLRARADEVRAIGPGLGTSARARSLVRQLLAEPFAGGTVLDADGLNALDGELELLHALRPPLVLTPHPGEAARLLGAPRIEASEAARREAALAIARRARAIVCLKGARTVVTDGERVHLNATGSAALATAGTGDVLTGILASYLARALHGGQGFTPFEAARSAVHVHGRAGELAEVELGQAATVASSLIEKLGAAQLELEGRAH